MKKKFKIKRKTNETKINLLFEFKSKKSYIDTGIPFFDHMLEQMSFHGNFYIKLLCKGDLCVDSHHVVEDVGIVLGNLFLKIIKCKKYKRYNYFVLPMEESITSIAFDICFRPFLFFKFKDKGEKILSNFSFSDVYEFFKSFSNNSLTNIHIFNKGKNIHHRIESIFKCFGKIINSAFIIKENYSYSTKNIK